MEIKNVLLPVEILLQIYNDLIPEDLSRLSRVNKANNFLIKNTDSLWKTKLERHFPDKAAIELSPGESRYDIFVTAYKKDGEYKFYTQKQKELCSLIKEHQFYDDTDKKENLKRIEEKIQNFDPKDRTYVNLIEFFFYYETYGYRYKKIEYDPQNRENHIFEWVMLCQDIKDVVYRQIKKSSALVPKFHISSLLKIAIKCHQIEEVKLSLDNKKIYKEVSKEGYDTLSSLFSYAVLYTNADLLGFLIKRFRPRDLHHILYVACEGGDVSLVECLLQAMKSYIDINKPSLLYNQTALLIACRRGRVNVVSRLLEIPGIDFSSERRIRILNKFPGSGPDYDQELLSPLQTAVVFDHPDVVSLLLARPGIESSLTPKLISKIGRKKTNKYRISTILKLILSKAAECNVRNSAALLIEALKTGIILTVEEMEFFIHLFKDKDKSNFYINGYDEEGLSLLYYAVARQDPQMVDFLLRSGAYNFSLSNDTPLHCAVKNRDLSLIQVLLKHIGNNELNKPNKDKLTALDFALGTNQTNLFHPEIAKLLFSRGAKANKINTAPPNYPNVTPLVMATLDNDIELMNYLFSNGAEVNPEGHPRYNPLIVAMQKSGNEGALELLLQKVDISVDKNNGLLTYAMLKKQESYIEILLRHGARMDDVTFHDMSLLHFAIEKKYSMENFLRHVIAQSQTTSITIDYNQLWKGLTPLNYAIKENNEEAIQFLLNLKEVDVNLVADNQEPPLNRAISKDNFELMQLLLQKGAMINHPTNPLLHFAINNDKIEIAFMLLEIQGIDVNQQNAQGETPIEIALKRRRQLLVTFDNQRKEKLTENLKLIAYLIEKMAHPLENFILTSAIQNNDTDLLQLLIDVETKFPKIVDFEASLLIAVKFRCVAIVKQLASHLKTKINAINSALHLAASEGDADSVAILLAKGADINAQNVDGLTPLHNAAVSKKSDVINLLLINKAQSNIKDKNFRTPSSIVKKTWERSHEKYRVLSQLDNARRKHPSQKVEAAGHQMMIDEKQQETYRKAKLFEMINRLMEGKLDSSGNKTGRKLAKYLGHREKRLQSCFLFHNKTLTQEKVDIVNNVNRRVTEVKEKLENEPNYITDLAVEDLGKIFTEAIDANKKAETKACKNYFFTHSHLNRELINIQREITEFNMIKRYEVSIG